jgi:hypothetical protein
MEVIRKGKAGKHNAFSKTLKLQDPENQIVIDYESTRNVPGPRTC